MSSREEYLKKSKYFEYMMPPEGVDVRERVNDFFWFDNSGVLHSVPKEKVVNATMEDVQRDIKEWNDEFGEYKMYMINVVNPHAKSNKEQRDFIAEIFPRYVKAIALINTSALGRMAINLFIGLRPPTYPLKTFKDYSSAREWIDGFIKDEE